jgi:voltage-gated potassium channel
MSGVPLRQAAVVAAYRPRMDHSRPLWRFLAFASALTSVGTFGYMWIEHWSAFDALYMTVITLSTVGFGEVRPLSTSGRAFTMVLIVSGVGSLAYLASSMAQYIANGTLTGIFRSQRMQRSIDALSDHFIVCGYGRVGRHVAEDVTSLGVGVVVVERDPTLLTGCNGTTPFVAGDASDDDVLTRAGIARARGLVAAAGEDATNLFITMSARALNPSIQIVARCTAPSTESKLLRAGATHVVSPYAIGGHRMAERLLMPHVTEFLDTTLRAMGADLWLEEITIGEGSPLVGRTIGDAFLRSPDDANVIAVRPSAGTAFVTNPSAASRIGLRDILIALGTRDQLRRLSAQAHHVPVRSPNLMANRT